MNKLTYAEAVKWIDRLMPETDLPDEGIEALAVLRRAEGVMGAVEGATLQGRLDHIEDTLALRFNKKDAALILRESLRHKEQAK